ncbi:TWiK family of potassium channels protein 12 [Ischnura elegans]|uniref:TWiK family of potassium channels protein 12 n=1 Tax=Ischnura elegans TaxID=197161 RepID=UPI001ED87E5B|nr:TWiK family of potassium channels protein 12 [Ischnura elegans]
MKRGMVRSNSVRSRGSSASTPPTPPTPMAPRERLKDCCRQLVAFMCTQVGVGGLVVGYALVGAFGFLSIETQAALEAEEQYMGKSLFPSGDSSEAEEKWWETHGNATLNSLALHRSGRGPWAVVHQLRHSTAAKLWAVTSAQNVFNESRWREGVGVALRAFQDGIAGAVKAGYDGRTVQEAWSFPAALTFSLSVFTMIGYGNLVPRSGWGKLATVVYAVLGIPLYVLYFMNMGRVLASTFRWLYTKMYQCTQDRVGLDDASSSKDGMEGGGGSGSGSAVRVIVPSTACLWVLAGYVLVGTIMFAEWEGWNYLDASYFCVTSLCKIGIGDFVPGTGIKKSKAKGEGGEVTMADTGEGHTKLVINFVYLLLGMGLIAMCYNLMREEVVVRARDLKARVSRWLESLRMRATECYYGPEEEESESEDEEEEEERERRRRRRRRRRRLERELREGRGRSLPPNLPQGLVPLDVEDNDDIEAPPREMLRRSYSTSRY